MFSVFWILEPLGLEPRLLLRGLVLMVSFVSLPLVNVEGLSYCRILLLLI